MSETYIPEEAGQAEAYFGEARSWAQDSCAQAYRSRRAAWTVAGCATTLAIVQALGLLAVLPLKTVVPYTVLVDRNTGFAQVLREGDRPAVSANAALVQSLLAQYVIAREAFEPTMIEQAYRKVALWSSDGARTEYLAAMANRSLPKATATSADATIAVNIESVTLSGLHDAQVRFFTERRSIADAAPQRDFQIATLHFRFSGQPMSLEDRLINPLGLQVSSYHVDQETPPAVLPQAPSMTRAEGIAIDRAAMAGRFAPGADVVLPELEATSGRQGLAKSDLASPVTRDIAGPGQ